MCARAKPGARTRGSGLRLPAVKWLVFPFLRSKLRARSDHGRRSLALRLLALLVFRKTFLVFLSGRLAGESVQASERRTQRRVSMWHLKKALEERGIAL